MLFTLLSAYGVFLLAVIETQGRFVVHRQSGLDSLLNIEGIATEPLAHRCLTTLRLLRHRIDKGSNHSRDSGRRDRLLPALVKDHCRHLQKHSSSVQKYLFVGSRFLLGPSAARLEKAESPHR